MSTSSTYSNDLILGYSCLYCNNPVLLYTKLVLTSYDVGRSVEEQILSEAIAEIVKEVTRLSIDRSSLSKYVNGTIIAASEYEINALIQGIDCPCPYCHGIADWQTDNGFDDMSLYQRTNYPVILTKVEAINWLNNVHEKQKVNISSLHNSEVEYQELLKWHKAICDAKDSEYTQASEKANQLKVEIDELQRQAREANFLNRNKFAKQIPGMQEALSRMHRILDAISSQQKACTAFDHFIQCYERGLGDDLTVIDMKPDFNGHRKGGALCYTYGYLGETHSNVSIEDSLIRLLGMTYLTKIGQSRNTSSAPNTSSASNETHAAIASEKSSTDIAQKVQVSQLLFCNKCGNRLPPDSQFCNKCGNKIQKPQVQYCNKCGSRLPPDSFFCNKCGNKIIT